MTRQVSPDALEAIAEREGLRLIAYQDEGGTWTIGYGHTIGVKKGDICTKDQALDWLKSDIANAEQDVCEAVKVILNDNQYGALVSFDFNVGHGEKGRRDGFVELKNGKPSTLLTLVNSLNFAAVPKEMLNWVKVGGVVDNGLVNRRNSEGGQWVKGSYVRGASITPDAPPPLWRRVWELGHVKVKAAGAAIGGMGIGAAQVKSVGSEIQSLAPSLLYLGIAVGFIGIVMELFHKES